MGTPARTFFGTGDPLAQASINISSAGANVVIPAVPGRSIIVLLYKIVCSGAVTVTWESSGGTVLDGPCSFSGNGGESAPYSEHGHFRTLRGEGLVIDLSAGVQVGGHLLYGVI